MSKKRKNIKKNKSKNSGKNIHKGKSNKTKINEIEITNDTLCDRGGLVLLTKYLENIRIIALFISVFGFLKKSNKGASLEEIFKQIICFFIDGTSFALTRFDELKKDDGYAAMIESEHNDLCSSHTIKRFFRKFIGLRSCFLKIILLKLFIWRLKIEKPKYIKLDIDTMVMDNDESEKKEGATPTYKKVKGFQPLQITWNKYIVDAIFREGSKHSNYGNHVVKILEKVVKKIRKHYSKDIFILLTADSGFMDQVNFEAFEKLGIAYICGGKIYKNIKEYVDKTDTESIKSFKKEKKEWHYIDFTDKRGTWNKSRRAIYMKSLYEGEQLLFDFARPETLLYTNIGIDEYITEKMIELFGKESLEGWWCIDKYHSRGKSELIHKAFKDFGTEQLPFLDFKQNAAFYYLMVISFNIFEAFKTDISFDVIPLETMATKFRRKLIDFAIKIVRHSNKIVVKLTKLINDEFNIQALWSRCHNPAYIELG